MRPRSEVITAVVVGVGIVLGTILLIWLMRPGTANDDSTGGLMTRQPRVWLLLASTLAALVAAAAWLIRGKRRPRRGNRRTWVAATSVAIVAGAIVLGILWPGGLIHHWPPQPKLDQTQTPNTTPPITTPFTTARPSVTTKPAAQTTVGSTNPKANPATSTTKGK